MNICICVCVCVCARACIISVPVLPLTSICPGDEPLIKLLYSPSWRHAVFCKKNSALHSINANINFNSGTNFVFIQALNEVIARIPHCHIQSVISPYIAFFYKLRNRETSYVQQNIIHIQCVYTKVPRSHFTLFQKTDS